jgi:two-component system, cell cycle response regulator
MDARMSTNTKAAYSVEVIGFNQTERIVLSSIFGLSARREPKFLQHSTVAYAPDLYLVDGADSQAVALFKARNATSSIPAIFIGDSNHGTHFPVLARPLQWTKLFKAFDLAIASRAAVPVKPQAAAPAPTMAPSLAPVATAVAPIAPVVQPPVSQAKSLLDDWTPTPARMPTASAPTVPAATTSRPPVSAPSHLQTQPMAVPAHTAPALPAGPSRVAATASDRDWVLVVDDNVTVREFMKTKLAPFGFNVDYAESGEQAIGLTGQKSYTCVFLDVIMPGIDGYQVCKLIKSKRVLGRKTAVVMLTSKGSPFDRIRGAMAGCDSYLTKPVDEDKLLETIVKFLPVAAT